MRISDWSSDVCSSDLMLLDGVANGIPVLASLREAIAHAGAVPDYLICGLAPADGLLSPDDRLVFLDGIARGMHIVNGLHEFLNDDAEFVAASLLAGVTMTDVRQPKAKKDLKDRKSTRLNSSH